MNNVSLYNDDLIGSRFLDVSRSWKFLQKWSGCRRCSVNAYSWSARTSSLKAGPAIEMDTRLKRRWKPTRQYESHAKQWRLSNDASPEYVRVEQLAFDDELGCSVWRRYAVHWRSHWGRERSRKHQQGSNDSPDQESYSYSLQQEAICLRWIRWQKEP